MGVLNVRLPDKVVSEIAKLAEKYSLTKSEIIRQALLIYIHLVKNIGTVIRPLALKVKPAQIDATRRGDVVILKIPTGHAIVVGSTSSGGVGPKIKDKVKADGRIVGEFMARVALIDVLSVGAFPMLVSVTMSIKKDPVGSEILEGVMNEVKTLGMDPSQTVSENTEEDVGTDQTGVGVTVVGFASEDDLRIGRTRLGDAVVAIGRPMVGEEVIPAEARGEIADERDVLSLLQKDFVHDIIAVGSLGIAHEAIILAYAIGRQIRFNEGLGIDLKKSAGPATVVLATMKPEKIDENRWITKKPFKVIGAIV